MAQDLYEKYHPNGSHEDVGGSRNTVDTSPDGTPATKANLKLHGMALSPNGDLVISEWGDRYLVRKIASPLPGLSNSEVSIPSQDGAELYVFDPNGSHLRTLNTSTGAIIWQFGYDSAGLLISVTDGDNDETTIQRDSSGIPTSIVAPDGQTTILALNGDGYLSTVTNPASEDHAFTYSTDGLLTKMTDPRLNDYVFNYNTKGRLILDADPAFGTQTLARIDDTDGKYTVTNTTALNRVSSFSVESLRIKGRNLRTTTDPSGFKTVTRTDRDDTQTITSPDGTITKITKTPDPRWGMLAPLSDIEVTTPGGLDSHLTTLRNVTLSDPADPLSLTLQTDTLDLNGRTFTSVFDANLLKVTDTTPVGRTTTAFVDSQGRILTQQVPSLQDTVFGYDPRGRLTTVTQSTGPTARASTIAYNPEGFINSITDPESRVVKLSIRSHPDE